MSDWQGVELDLREVLKLGRSFWQGSPYGGAPAWRDTPVGHRLHDTLMRLDDDSVARLGAGDHDGSALHTLLRAHLPMLDTLAEATSVIHAAALVSEGAESTFAQAQARLESHGLRDVPGRKLAQIEAFADAVGAPQAAVLEWCAGKGHLGRVLAAASAREVLSVERDQTLCRNGAALAQRAQLDQQFCCADVMQASVSSLCHDRHAVALHACGDLHRRLVQLSGPAGLRRLDLAPCCYHLGSAPEFGALTGSDDLPLTRADLRLAVTGHATASAAERRRHMQLLAWKFAYRLMAARAWGVVEARLPASRDLPRGCVSFAEWCGVLAQREGLDLPGAAALREFESEGAAAAAHAERDGLVRLAFRRALEVWLVMRLALALEAQGFTVALSRFCSETLTPRNLLVSARR